MNNKYSNRYFFFYSFTSLDSNKSHFGCGIENVEIKRIVKRFRPRDIRLGRFDYELAVSNTVVRCEVYLFVDSCSRYKWSRSPISNEKSRVSLDWRVHLPYLFKLCAGCVLPNSRRK